MRHFVWIVLAAGILLLPQTSHSQALHIVGVDFMAQSIKRESQSTIAGWGLRMRLDSIDLPKGLVLMPTVERWRDKNSFEELGFYSSQSDFAVGVDGVLQWQMGGVEPYAGLGLSAHFLKTELQAPDQGIPQSSNSSTEFGPNFLLGVMLPSSGHFQPYVEGKYQYAPPVRQLRMNFGFGWNF